MLNLLPPEIKNLSKVRSKVSNLALAYFFVTAIIVLGTIGLFAYNITLKSVIADKNDQLANLTTEKKSVKATADKLAFIQDRLTQATTYQNGEHWDEVISLIASDTPVSVQLSNLKVTTDGAKGSTISLSGKSPSRRDIILFKDKLATEATFQDVALAAMATSAGTDGALTFSIQMGVKK